MPVLGEGLGHLDAETVEEEVVLVAVLVEQLLGSLRDPGAHRHDVECGVIDLAVLGAEEVGDGVERLLLLPREGETGALRGTGLVFPDH